MTDKTINQLTTTTTAAEADLLPIWVTGSGVTRNVTRANLLSGVGRLASANTWTNSNSFNAVVVIDNGTDGRFTLENGSTANNVYSTTTSFGSYKMLAFHSNASGPQMVLSGNNVGIGTTSPQGQLHVHDGTGGFMFVTKTGIAGTAVTIIPDGTGDAVYTCALYGVVRGSDGDTVSVGVEIPSNTNYDFYAGSDQFRIALATSGALTCVRLSGTTTLTLSLVAIWL